MGWGSLQRLRENSFSCSPVEVIENPAPEGRPNLAQRLSAGKVEEMIQVPEESVS